MKILVGLCILAVLACASADCGCLKCNPQLQVVSPRYSPCKVIYRNNNLNLPSIAPYKLQAAVPPPPPVFVPKEYDYQMQYLPYATPYVGSVYEYGLQAAVPPPPPVHIPLKNLRTGVERVVMDAPFNALVCGTSTCHNGAANKLPLPAPLPIGLYRGGCGCGRSSCGCNSDRYDSMSYRSDRCDSDEYRSDSYGRDSCGRDSSGRDSGDYNDCDCDSCSRARVPLLKNEEENVNRGPIIEPVQLGFCSRYAPIFIRNFPQTSQGIIRKNLNLDSKKFRRKRDLLRGSRYKRDIIDLPMNFMFKFVPNMLRGPILHAINTMQHNANPAVARARANANKHKIQAHLARSKYKLKQQKSKNHTPLSNNKNSKQHTKSPNVFNIHSNVKEENKYSLNSMVKSPQKRHHTWNPADADEMIPVFIPLDQLRKTGKHLRLNQENNVLHHFRTLKPTNKLNSHFVVEDEDQPSSSFGTKYPKLGSKYNIDGNERVDITADFVGKTNDFLKDIFSALGGKSRTPKDNARSNHKRQRSLDEIRNHLRLKGYSNEDIRDILLAKMKRFNEIYEREKRSISPVLKKNNNNPEDSLDHSVDEKHETKSRRKRGVLLDTDQFQLPFFEIEDEILDNYYSENSDEGIVGLKQKKKKSKHRRHYDDSEMESGEEILGASHPMHDHPFVVLLRTPLKLLHHFHDIRKNFQPILYSFPKILHSSRKYLKDFSKNLQTGVLDFASNIMGDFGNQVPKRYDSFFLPSRQRRSIKEDEPKSAEKNSALHRRDKRYILKVVDEKEVQEFLEEKLGGYFDDGEEEEKEKNQPKEEESEERVGNAENNKKTGEKKFIVKKLSPKLILDNNGKPFIEINGNKRPLFFGKNKNKSPLLQKSKPKTHEALTSKPEKTEEEDIKHDEINDKIDEVIAQARQKLQEGEILKSVNCDEIPTQTVKEKINQISSYIQNLVSLDCSKYADLYENFSKLEKMKKSVTEYWKNVMINEKTNDIQCKIKILNYIRDMQNEKDTVTKKIAEHLKEGDNFIVKKLIKMLVRLQKLQCLIQKIVEHFDNRMKIGTISDTEKEIKFVDFLSSLSFHSATSEEEFVSSLKKEKHECLHREIKLLENLRLLLQKDDTYITNEVAKQIWEMRNIEKLQLGAIEEMNAKLGDNMKIRKELKILFDLLKQTEASEDACEKLLMKIGDNNLVGSKFMLKNGKRQIQRPSLSEILEKIRSNSKAILSARKQSKNT